MDAETVRRAQQHDSAAWEELYKATVREAYFVALKVCGKEQDAMDLLQDAYLIAYERIGQLKEPDKFQPWLYMIVANQCRDYLKKKKPFLFTELEQEDGPVLDWEDDRVSGLPECNLDHQETVRLIAEMIESLPEDQKLCVTLFYRDELSVQQIAEALQVSEGTVKSRLNYARQKVKAKVELLEKQGTKLYGLAPMPLLALLLKSEAKAVELPAGLLESPAFASTGFKVGAASAAKTSTSTAAVSKAGVGLLQGIAIKAVAGTLGICLLVGGGVAVKGKIEERQQAEQNAAEQQLAEERLAQQSEAALQAYQELLKKGGTERGLPIRYYAYLDLNQDGINELLVADALGDPEHMTECELYSYQDGQVLYCDATGSWYDYLYIANDTYVRGSSRMGAQFVGINDSIKTTSYHWDEAMTRNDPARCGRNSEWEYITEQEFRNYNLMPDPGTLDSGELFVKTSEVIELQENEFHIPNMLETSLDFSKAWTIIEPVGGEVQYATTYAFTHDGKFYCIMGYYRSDIMSAYCGTYTVDGNSITFEMVADGVSKTYSYRMEKENTGLQLTQTSKNGLFAFHKQGDVFRLREDEWQDAMWVRDICENGLDKDDSEGPWG